MEEPIIIDTQLQPDDAYEPLQKTLATILTKPKALITYADLIRHECKMHGNCYDCTFYDKDENYPICVLMMRTPADWALENLSQLKEEG